MAKIRFNAQIKTCPFPKHEGRLWTDIIEDDRQYVEWLVSGEGPPMSDLQYDYLINLLEEI